jgi:hypothetical protein
VSYLNEKIRDLEAQLQEKDRELRAKEKQYLSMTAPLKLFSSNDSSISSNEQFMHRSQLVDHQKQTIID